MLEVLALSLLLLTQDPKPAPKTVEDRLKELSDRLSALEKKEQAISLENAALEKQVADQKATRENLARQAGAAWVKQNGAAIGLNAERSTEFEELWTGWTREDMEKGMDPARWKAREETLRTKLSPDEIPRLGRKVREIREESAKRRVNLFAQGSRLGPEKSAALADAVIRKLAIKEGILVVQAHPEETVLEWGQLISAAEACVPELSPGLTEEERARFEKALAPWKAATQK